MKQYTWEEIELHLENKHDIGNEFTTDELMEIVNEGINRAESRIVVLNKDYFLATTGSLAISTGISEYALPEDIYAHKIRRVMHTSSTGSYYPIKELRNLDDLYSQSKSQYKHKILNTDAGKVLKLYPSPVEDSTMEIYYTKNANRMTVAGGNNQVCDIPEFIDVVLKYCTMRVYEKDMSPLLNHAKSELLLAEKLMTDTLASGVNDGDNEIEVDTSFYDDSTGYYEGDF